MRAIVCDKCGKVVLLEDGHYDFKHPGINLMDGPGLPNGKLDLCDECVAELISAVRELKGDSSGRV